MFRMQDEAGPDEKLLCVPVGDPRQEHLQDIRHVSEFDRLEIQHFFEVYKDLEPGKSVEGATWVGRTEAEQEIQASRQRLRSEEHTSELQSRQYLVCRLLLEKKKNIHIKQNARRMSEV